ncbi:uncharacterized protein LOC121597462 [Anopheles merus]|uniref:uncharacterized protein LOC121597462 n=1 Tax=Anopheles merus TaxID=30066 RepID=UPI001BE4D1FD|nr:uncharacterized protein LOC121597462 [Anopheles merus]
MLADRCTSLGRMHWFAGHCLHQSKTHKDLQTATKQSHSTHAARGRSSSSSSSRSSMQCAALSEARRTRKPGKPLKNLGRKNIAFFLLQGGGGGTATTQYLLGTFTLALRFPWTLSFLKRSDSIRMSIIYL